MIDTRTDHLGRIRRRRRCLNEHRFSTLEEYVTKDAATLMDRVRRLMRDIKIGD